MRFLPLVVLGFIFTAQMSHASSDFCVAHLESGEEGAPQYWYDIDCKGEDTIRTKPKWCWSFSQKKSQACVSKVAEAMKSEMNGKGYDLVAHFPSEGAPFTRYVFQKSEKANTANQFCYVTRSFTQTYEVNCGDGALTTLKNLDVANHYDGIQEYMKKSGYELGESFERKHTQTRLIFVKSAI